jgi:hypothetical protein
LESQFAALCFRALRKMFELPQAFAKLTHHFSKGVAPGRLLGRL